jgi:hypothetical protein
MGKDDLLALEPAQSTVEKIIAIVDKNPQMPHAGVALAAACELQREIYNETKYYYSGPPDVDNG